MDLSLVDEKDLVEELKKRYDHFVIAARKDKGKLKNGTDFGQWKRDWEGDIDVCIGLCHSIIHDCLMKQWGINESDIKY